MTNNDEFGYCLKKHESRENFFTVCCSEGSCSGDYDRTEIGYFMLQDASMFNKCVIHLTSWVAECDWLWNQMLDRLSVIRGIGEVEVFFHLSSSIPDYEPLVRLEHQASREERVVDNL